jgi:diketogulonate reductase-like aldo/keto reductase
MNTVMLPGGEPMPALGIGTWRMGERPRQRADEVAALRLALDLGIRLIDTAEMYGDGGAEEVVAEAIDGRRDGLFIVTKVLPGNASRAGTIAACERSLARLRTDRIDLYLLHWRGGVPLAETVEALARLQRAGKIRHWGVSNFDAADMAELWLTKGGSGCAVNQVYYSASRRGIEFDLLPWQRARGIPAMAYCPLDEGKLALDRTLAQVGLRHDATAAQAAIAWLLAQPGVVAIPKAVRLEHVRALAAVPRLRLDAADLAAIDRRFPPPKSAQPLAIV